jgi:hypothetical protein
MNDPKRPQNPLNSIVPTALVADRDRRPTIVRPTVRDREGMFRGWGPSI